MSLINSKILPILFSLSLFSCAVPKELAPVVAGEQGKAQLLQEAIGNVHKSVLWGDPTIAFENVHPRIFPGYFAKMIGDPKQTRVMEVTPTGLELDEVDDKKATSTVEIKVFGNPTYSVRTITKKESWEFSRMSGGWKLTAVDETPQTAAK